MTRIATIIALLFFTAITGSLTACQSIQSSTESHDGYGGGGHGGGVGGGSGGGGHGGGGR
ncbi:hypothetical protein BN59_01667 [Legionella massiliensis]|uniref:Lipoprotein n=1 Tax=Legionella massiliensis TaxID=1034943 RepID=A0A078L003_9GAMM|nr:hypothetical protein [Legionella massiliensis]CDZ77384.1 hypothetical protein BN59_01667 [Legionella massiliensis]CEE13122.1 hypothetical protein BN1094_01667 [Legionella massiliensis]